MTRQKSVLRQIALRLPEIASFCCAALMLCVIPLYFDDAFFNINRCKVSLIRTATPWLLALMAVSLCASRLPGEKKRLERPIAPDICMAAFLLACVIACARQGFNEDVTEAANGRNLGLWLMLCLCAAYYIVALGEIDGRLLAACMLLCAAICAGLGILNAAGIDPLGFYQNIKRKLKITFFSTIGNADVRHGGGRHALFKKEGVSSVGGGMRDFADSGDARVPNGQRGGGNAAGLPDHAGACVRKLGENGLRGHPVGGLLGAHSGGTGRFEQKSLSSPNGRPVKPPDEDARRSRFAGRPCGCGRRVYLAWPPRRSCTEP